MEWQFKPVARKSDRDDQPFTPGQVVVSYLTLDSDGNFERTDVIKEGDEMPVVPEDNLGWWAFTVREKDDSEAAARRAAMKTTEGLFLSLFPNPEDEAASDTDADLPETQDDDPDGEVTPIPGEEERDILKYLLALMLERKRTLKPLGRARVGQPQRYRHPKSDREFEVPAITITAENMLRIQEQLAAVVGIRA